MSEQKPSQEPSNESMTNRQAYNVLSDTIAGPNLRLKDNLYQGLAILVCLLVGAGIGFLVITDGLAGALVGGFIGMVVGLFGSGVFLMIFRAIKHVRGHHD